MPNARTSTAVAWPREGRLEERETQVEPLAGAFLAGYGSARTRAAYGSDLRDFVAWCEEHDLGPLDAERAHVEVYARELERRGRAPATVARRLSTLASFYRYAVEEGVLDRSPAVHIRRPRVSQDSPTLGLDRSELVRLLDAADDAGPRDHALVCLLALCGLRVSEACGANVADLEEQRGHRILRIIRKGSIPAVVPLAPRTIAAVDLHVAGRAAGPLLVAADGSRLDRHDAARVIRRLARQAGIAKALTPHGLRHSFVTLALEAGVPLHRVQDAAGHADPRTTRRYDRARYALDGHATYTLAAFLPTALAGRGSDRTSTPDLSPWPRSPSPSS
jgi:site-specific recombinase XerD